MTADAVGGVLTYALELADALAGHDVEVHLALMGPRMSPAQRAAALRSAAAEVHEGGFALEWMPGRWGEVDAAGDWLLGLAASLRPDTVHLNGYVHGALPWHAPVVVVGHSCVCSWWWAVHGVAAPPAWDAYRHRVAAGLAGADAVVVPTADMGLALRRWYGCGGATVIVNCRGAGWVRPLPKEPLVVGAGRVWDAAKNLALLDAVAPQLPWPVVIAGEMSGDVSAAAPGPPSARLLGELPFAELAGWLMRASIFVAPARYEPFGLAALEAAHAGCALVLGDIPSLREVWGDAATYVAPDDDAGLVTAVRKLVADPAALRSLGERARRRARDHLPARTAAAYARLYGGLAVRAGAGA